MYDVISSMGDNVNEISEPKSGSVVRVDTPRAKYPEIWVSSYINGGRWYPDTDSWLGGSARHDHPEGCDWYTLRRRGAITLLTDVDREAYRAGWDAGVAAAAQAAEEMEGECPL
jgi:hypothetical protein